MGYPVAFHMVWGGLFVISFQQCVFVSVSSNSFIRISLRASYRKYAGLVR